MREPPQLPPDTAHRELSPDRLRRRCRPEGLGFATTAEIEPTDRLIGQERAVKALEFGLGVKVDGYNIFVMGPTGTGKTTYTRALLGRVARERSAPPDWCYVHNFNRPEEPNAISLPPGMGPRLKRDMERLIRALRSKIPEAFATDDYRKQQSELKREFIAQTQRVMQRVEQAAASRPANSYSVSPGSSSKHTARKAASASRPTH